MKKHLAGTAAIALVGGLLASTSAFAQFAAVATTDLNIRSGPGPQYPVVGTIAGNDETTVNGCAEGSKWCQVSYNGVTGWSYSDYLSGSFGTQQVVVSEAPATVNVPVVTYQSETTASISNVPPAGTLLKGPVGAATVTPPPTVQTYVVDNRVDPVYLDGEVVVGAGVPDTVQLLPVPDYDYSYHYVNGQPVLVDPTTRQIVYVYR